MINGLVGKKLGMTQIFDRDGNVLPVTVIEAGPCTVLELKDSPFKKVILGFENIKESRVNKAQMGYFKKSDVIPKRIIREFESTENKDYSVGQALTAEVFKAGDYVDITGVSHGKGFQGGMKRWGWSGGPAGHGSMHHRRVGSIGASADPSKTVRGRHMPGRMGGQNVTVQETNTVIVKGAVPGRKNSILMIRLSKKKLFRSFDDKKVATIHKVNLMKHSKAKASGKGK